MKTLLIVGAGKGIGMSIARRFGKENFRIALIARTESKLIEMVDELGHENITASYFIADIKNESAIKKAIQDVKNEFGTIDVVEFSPQPILYPPTSVLSLTIENARDSFEGFAASSIIIVNEILPEMIERKSGALLFTTGFSSINPFPMMGNYGVGLGALRNYITNLHTELKAHNVYVGHRALALMVESAGTGTDGDPDVIADMWYNEYLDQNNWESVYPIDMTVEKLLSSNLSM